MQPRLVQPHRAPKVGGRAQGLGRLKAGGLELSFNLRDGRSEGPAESGLERKRPGWNPLSHDRIDAIEDRREILGLESGPRIHPRLLDDPRKTDPAVEDELSVRNFLRRLEV